MDLYIHCLECGEAFDDMEIAFKHPCHLLAPCSENTSYILSREL